MRHARSFGLASPWAAATQGARRLVEWLAGRLRHSRYIRRDDQAQVMVLTAVMVFMVAIFAFSTLNTSTLLYNRIRTQTAVDAAADAYALWQARAMNVEQHGNDILFEAHIAWTLETLINCLMRITCIRQWCCCSAKDWANLLCSGDVGNCCNGFNNRLSATERQQRDVTQAIQAIQRQVNIHVPRIGWLEANAMAEANGADPIVTGPVATAMEELIAELGAPNNLANILTAVSTVPGAADVYVVPLDIKAVSDYGLRRQGEPGALLQPFDSVPYRVNGRCFGEDLFCFFSTCDTHFLPPFIIFPPNACDYTCAAASTDVPGQGSCGWYTPFYHGLSPYNTWMAGKRELNISPTLNSIPWLNPLVNPDQDPNVAVSLKEFDDFAIYNPQVDPTARSEFLNAAFVTMASSRAFGTDTGLQPLLPLTSRFIGGFEYARPQIINVHVGLLDAPAEALFIYH